MTKQRRNRYYIWCELLRQIEMKKNKHTKRRRQLANRSRKRNRL